MRVWSAQAALHTIRASWVQRQPEWRASLLCGSLASALALAAVVPLGWHAHRRPGAIRWMGLLMGVFLALPGPVLALALIMAFNQEGVLGYIYDSMWMLVIGLALRVWPFVFLAVWAPLRMVPVTILEASRVDGAGGWQTFRHIQLPLSVVPAALGFLTGLALCIGELAVSDLLKAPGITPLSVQIFSLLHSGLYSEVAGITLLLVFFVLVLGGCLTVAARLIPRMMLGEQSRSTRP